MVVDVIVAGVWTGDGVADALEDYWRIAREYHELVMKKVRALEMKVQAMLDEHALRYNEIRTAEIDIHTPFGTWKLVVKGKLPE